MTTSPHETPHTAAESDGQGSVTRRRVIGGAAAVAGVTGLGWGAVALGDVLRGNTDPARNTALIIGDIQRGITSNYAFARQVVPPLTELLPRARAAGVLVVFVHIAFRANGADLPPGNAMYRSFFDAGDSFHEGSAGTEIDLPVTQDDVVVLKRRASAFAGTDLDLVLRARGVDTVAIAGVATGAMVAATCYDASDRGYEVTVLHDGCADSDPAMHDFFMNTVFPSRGFEVVDCAGWHGKKR
ncbi:isochorismatase family cysteine hydrolase [Nocardia sp. NPDC049707]|uniref:cysteine hydrolase family protein n=1 Tax=Nocardia sp. NPDC049707 TaxID=3154735 RepID=UPI00343DAF95